MSPLSSRLAQKETRDKMDNEEPGSIQKPDSSSSESVSENRPKWSGMNAEGGFLEYMDEDNRCEAEGGKPAVSEEVLGRRIGGSFAERLAARTGVESARLNTARFKAVPPSSLPIARSPCLTIPPGLSPTTLLDSPVLLSNTVEPSPTTGAFSLPPFLFASNAACDSPSICLDVSKNKGCEDGSSNFVFKPYTKFFSGPNPSPLGGLGTFGSSNEQAQSQSQSQSQSQTLSWTSPVYATEKQFALSPSTECKVISTTADGPLHVAPLQAIPSRASSTQSTTFEEKQQRQDCIMQVRAPEVDQNVLVSLGITEKPSEDGYNWRKYGQKIVKGSEYPRSYYKCTHPKCQMKKKLERSHDGQITEIVYKGVHDHPKPQPSRRSALGAGHAGHDGEDRSEVFGGVSRIEDLSSTMQGQTSYPPESTGTPELSSSDDDGEVGEKLLGEDADEDESDSKRRKIENSSIDIITANRAIREPRVVVQTTSEIDILDDGYRWRKYGQKVVKGNPNPRSYYKCTNAGCPVRKHVERASHDPKAVITTYEGKHNHDVPAPRNGHHDNTGTGNAQSSAAMQSNVCASTNNNISRSVLQVPDTLPDFERHPGQTYMFDRVADGNLNSQDRNASILNLGVGSSMGFGKLGFDNSLRSMSLGISGIGRPAGSFQSYFGQAKDRDMDLLNPKEEMPETFNFGASVPVNHSSNSSIYHQSMGRLLMGP